MSGHIVAVVVIVALFAYFWFSVVLLDAKIDKLRRELNDRGALPFDPAERS